MARFGTVSILPELSTTGKSGAGRYWEAAKRITDTRLRAMRFWLEERESPETRRNFARVHTDLVIQIERLGEQAKGNRHLRDEAQALKVLAERVRESKLIDWTKFPSIYAFIGLAMPVSVKGSAREFTGYKSHNKRFVPYDPWRD